MFYLAQDKTLSHAWENLLMPVQFKQLYQAPLYKWFQDLMKAPQTPSYTRVSRRSNWPEIIYTAKSTILYLTYILPKITDRFNDALIQ